MSKDYLLIAAVKDGDKLKAQNAIDEGARVDCRDHKGQSILEVAEHCRQNHLVRFLVQAGANPNQIVGKQGNSLLQRCILRHNSGFARALMECDADFHNRNLAGENALMLAVKAGDVYLANELIRGGAKINDKSRSGNTALHHAAKAGHTEMVSMLLKYEPDTQLTNRRHYTALQEAIASGHRDASALLLERMILDSDNLDGQIVPARKTAERHRQPKLLELLIASETTPTQSFSNRFDPDQQPPKGMWR